MRWHGVWSGGLEGVEIGTLAMLRSVSSIEMYAYPRRGMAALRLQIFDWLWRGTASDQFCVKWVIQIHLLKESQLKTC